MERRRIIVDRNKAAEKAAAARRLSEEDLDKIRKAATADRRDEVSAPSGAEAPSLSTVCNLLSREHLGVTLAGATQSLTAAMEGLGTISGTHTGRVPLGVEIQRAAVNGLEANPGGTVPIGSDGATLSAIHVDRAVGSDRSAFFANPRASTASRTVHPVFYIERIETEILRDYQTRQLCLQILFHIRTVSPDGAVRTFRQAVEERINYEILERGPAAFTTYIRNVMPRVVSTAMSEVIANVAVQYVGDGVFRYMSETTRGNNFRA